MSKYMKNAIIYLCDASPFYVYFKKHFCPNCGKKLKTHRIIKTVNSKSPEAKKYDFYLNMTAYSGDVEFRIKCFQCSDCQLDIMFDDMKKHEKTIKNNRKR